MTYETTLLEERDEMLMMSERLVTEFSGQVPPGKVFRCVHRCRRRLLHSGVRRGLVPATEAAVRVTLRATLPRSRTAA